MTTAMTLELDNNILTAINDFENWDMENKKNEPVSLCVPEGALVDAMKFINTGIEKKEYIPIIQYVLFTQECGQLKLISTNLEAYLEINLGDNFTASDNFENILIYGKDLWKAMKVFASKKGNGLIDLEELDKASGLVRLSINSDSVEINTNSIDQYPYFQNNNVYPQSASFDLCTGKQFKNIAKELLFATTKEESRFALNGIGLFASQQKLTFVATDGHRLAYQEMPNISGVNLSGMPINSKDYIGNGKSSLILPEYIFKHIVPFVNDNDMVQIGFTEGRYAIIQFDNKTVKFRPLEGQFPNYEAVIPTHNNSYVTVNKKALLTACTKVAAFADEVTRATRFHLGNVKLRLEASNLGKRATSAIEIDSYSNAITAELAFNIEYFIEYLKIISGEEVTIKYRDESTQILLEDGGGTKYVIMPMRN